ncbi:MAG: glycosyltransferase [Kordiimonadaceae bacterium]|nr:glycosyltransferase [Kordiimonadaceae bacterium]
MALKEKNIAYLAPAIPALSETFVYNEIFALRERDYKIFPLSIHRPVDVSESIREKMGPVHYLYKDGVIIFIMAFFQCLFTRPMGTLKALGLLISDFFHVGLFNLAAYKLIYQFFAACRAARLFIVNGNEHIHVHFGNVPCQVAMYASAISSIPFTVTSHANDIFEHGLLLKRKAERAKYFVTISDFNRRFLLEIGLPANKIRIVRCGVDLKYDGAEKNTSEKIRLCSLGRLVEKKGMLTLIDAVALLKERGVPVSLSIAGDGPERGQIEKSIAEKNLTDHVEMIGALDNKDVGPWMAKHDIFVLACQKDKNGDMDGIPVVLMEAMMLGLSVISTRISGIPELIIDGKTGLLVEPKDAEALAEAIVKRDIQHSLIDNAANHVLSEFGRDVNIDRLETLFNE